jgi:ribosomal protein S18 acetylase RimI-like enzyme
MRGWAPLFACFDGAHVEDVGGVLCWRSAVPLPLLNAAHGAADDVAPVIDGFFGDGRAFLWVAPADSPTPALLAERGLHVVYLPAMSMALADLPPLELPDGVEIRAVDDDAEALAEATRISLVTNGFPEDVTQAFVDAYERAGLDTVVTFLGTADGVPAAASSLLLADGVAALYNVGTLEEHRGRGLGRAISLAALHAGREAGRAWGVLQATPDGEPVYRKLGFRERYRVAMAVRLPA